jgi:glutathione synthase/RimK-type ligase-like ATP-grasp enzyme
MIVVLSEDGDSHADAVEEELRRLGVPAVRFDPARFPTRAGVSVRIDASGRVDAALRDGDAEIALSSADAVWMRRPNRPRAPEAWAGTAVGAAIEAEASDLFADLWELLDVPFVPATPAVTTRASRKMHQLGVAGRLGFEIPDTLVTNDPDAFLDRYAAASGRLITKRSSPNQRLVTPDGVETGRGTLAVRPRDLVEIESLRHAPILTQAIVDKDVELRVTVVGDEVFAAAIHSQETHHTQIDFRNYDASLTRITPYQLPAEVEHRCVALTRALGLRYSAIDLIVTPEGRTVFLEINPNGQYLWIERATGQPISRALATLLARRGQPR